MKLSKRWKFGLLITAWIAAVAVMVRYAYPNSFRRASDFGRYQQDLTRTMTERNARNAEQAAPAPAPDDAPPPAPPPPGD